MQGSELEGIDCVDDGVCYIAKVENSLCREWNGRGRIE
jgi:hypothetical protein